MDTQQQNQQAVPKDALEKPTEEPSPDAAASTTASPDAAKPDAKPPKKPSKLKVFFHKVNVYLLLFIFLIVIAAVVGTVSYLNGKKTPPSPKLSSQALSEDVLKQLENTDAVIGDAAQTLTVQGNAVFSGQVLIRSDLSVAGTIKVGGTLSVPGFNVSGKTSLSDTQISSLQVANNTILQGDVTLQKGLTVGGATAFSAPVTAGQLTVTKLVMSGNASLQVNNHIAFTGASPSRTSIANNVLGLGGTVSINGSDTTGTININSGTGAVPGCFVSVTFNQPFTSAPHVLVSPIGAGAGQIKYYVNRSTTGFSLCTVDAAPDSQVFAFDYFITQ